MSQPKYIYICIYISPSNSYSKHRTSQKGRHLIRIWFMFCFSQNMPNLYPHLRLIIPICISGCCVGCNKSSSHIVSGQNIFRILMRQRFMKICNFLFVVVLVALSSKFHTYIGILTVLLKTLFLFIVSSAQKPSVKNTGKWIIGERFLCFAHLFYFHNIITKRKSKLGSLWLQ